MSVRDAITEKNGIKIYIEDQSLPNENYSVDGLHRFFKSEETHFWFVSRKRRIFSLFEKYISKKSKIIEIGAGTGNVTKELIKGGYQVSAGEIHFDGLRYAQSYGVENCYQFDLMDPPFNEHFDVVGIFDVLEHIEDDHSALKNIQQILKQSGYLVLTVPAHQWLWNRYDAIEGHHRRYELKELKKSLKKAGFEVVQANYFFIFILPLLYLRRLLQKDNKSTVGREEKESEIKINPLVNKFLLGLSTLENKIHQILPNIAGGSIILIAQKK